MWQGRGFADGYRVGGPVDPVAQLGVAQAPAQQRQHPLLRLFLDLADGGHVVLISGFAVDGELLLRINGRPCATSYPLLKPAVHGRVVYGVLAAG